MGAFCFVGKAATCLGNRHGTPLVAGGRTLYRLPESDPPELPQTPRVENGSEEGIVVMTWNVLADGAAQYEHEQRTGQRNAAVVSWPSRSRMAFTSEIEQVSPDLLLLVECNRFEEFWVPEMQRLGLSGVFAPRYDEAVGVWPVPAVYCGAPSDGCAIFYREAAFDLLWSEALRFRPTESEVAHNALLRPKSGTRHSKLPTLLIGVAHLQDGNNPKSAEIRKQQVSTWAKFLEQKRASVTSSLESGGKVDVIIAGDLNEPTLPSDSFEHVAGAAVELKETLRLVSAYVDDEPVVTAAWGRSTFCAMDFIFHSGNLRPIERLAMPSVQEVLESGPDGLPSPSYPSDHVSLAARLCSPDECSPRKSSANS